MKSLCAILIGISIQAMCPPAALSQDDEKLDKDRILSIDVRNMPPPTELACFSVRGARSFDALEDRYVYVRGLRDEHYLLTLEYGCFGLRSAFGITIASHFDRVCSNDFASITFRRFDQLESCRIREVESVASRESAEEIARIRTQ